MPQARISSFFSFLSIFFMVRRIIVILGCTIYLSINHKKVIEEDLSEMIRCWAASQMAFLASTTASCQSSLPTQMA
jgi:hypothetical protein